MDISGLFKTDKGLELGMYTGSFFQGEDKTEKIESISAKKNSCHLKVNVDDKKICNFLYSFDGKKFKVIGKEFTAAPGVWIEAKVDIFDINPNIRESKGYADFDRFIVE